jgi:hypothetical protein
MTVRLIAGRAAVKSAIQSLVGLEAVTREGA